MRTRRPTWTIDIKVLKDLGEAGAVRLLDPFYRPPTGDPELQMGKAIAGDRPPRYGIFRIAGDSCLSLP